MKGEDCISQDQLLMGNCGKSFEQRGGGKARPQGIKGEGDIGGGVRRQPVPTLAGVWWVKEREGIESNIGVGDGYFFRTPSTPEGGREEVKLRER